MLTSKEENITQVIDGIELSTFSLEEGDTIFVTVDLNKINLDMAHTIFEKVVESFPSHNVYLKTDSITLESQLEDDLK